MTQKYLLLFFFSLLSGISFCQNDTINQRDDQGKKQGYWINYGKDRPELGYADSAIIDKGRYVNGRKEGEWIRFNKDGTPKIKGTYRNGRPSGTYSKGSMYVSRDSHLKEKYTLCCDSVYDSIVVRLGDSNMYGPITDTTMTFYFKDASQPINQYIDSLACLDATYADSDGQFCSHTTNITIVKYRPKSVCSIKFSTCYRRSVIAEITKECALKVFNFSH
jgi:hypothetical protein